MRLIFYPIFIFLSLALIFRPQQIAKSTCGGWDPNYYESYQFFAPISFAEMADFDWQVDSTAGDNLQEWKTYFKNKPRVEDIKQLVYETSSDDMQKVRATILKATSPLPNALKDNSLVKYLIEKREISERDALETIDYLFYAKVCEPEAVNDESWEERKRDTEKMKWLADAGKKYYKEKASNDFLKLRFAYQAIRMAHYTKQYDKVLRWYDELVEPISMQTESIIRYWNLALRAGALKNLGKKGEAAYYFSLVFDKCMSKRASSFLSFEIGSESEWKQALALCKDNDEKTTLYFLRALQPNALGLEEMQNIYQLLPNSPKLNLLLAREINKLESDLLNINLNENLLFFKSYQGFPKAEAIQQLNKLKTFVNQVVSDKKASQPEVWALASGYLDYVAGNPQKATQIFNDLAKNTRDKSLKNQIELFRLAMQISSLTKIDEQAENQLYEQVKETKHTHLHDFLINSFARLYQKQGEIGKAFLCKNAIWDIKSNPKMDLLDNLLALTDKKKLSDFEKDYLFKKITNPTYYFEEENSKPARFSPHDILLEVKATVLFGQDKLEEAIAVYKQIPEDVIYKIEGDPFQANIKDCQDCPNSIGKGKYNRLSLAQKIVQLKKIAEKNTVEQDKVYFQLGNIYYNMTHFGNSWLAVDYVRSGSDLWNYKSTDIQPENREPIFVDCSKAKYYFERAMNGAIKNGNPEMAAQAAYLAAKCEQNEYYLRASGDGWGYILPSYEPQNRRYFALIKKEFKKTQYYRELLKECSYFNTFVNIR
ncbi:MAG: hypothetical protein MUE85_23405 [Microscillaceae bacterium]|jgi:hypothetical protein|nr:hypothetical protein [Microscillaceae bacterium]